jgi:hypothetical protein
MSTWFALLYRIKPGSKEVVSELFRESGRPDHDVKDGDGNLVGRLLRTIVFVGEDACVRVVEIEGDLRTVAQHMSRQAEVQDFEDEIEQYLREPRDMKSPQGALEFFRMAGMQCVLDRKHDD